MTPIYLEISPAQLAALRSQIHRSEVPTISLAVARSLAEFSQDELAAAVDCSRVYISQLERGEQNNISLKLARRIAEVLGYSIDQLFPEEQS